MTKQQPHSVPKLRLAASALFLFFSAEVVAQHQSVPQLRGAIVMGYAHIPQAFEGDKTVAVIPMWGLDLDYVFHRKWAVVLQTDVKLQSFEVEDKQDLILSRNFPVSVAALAHFRPIPHWSVFVGPGREYEQTKSLWIFKIGSEYSFEFSERFELGVLLMYENREELYDGWTLGVSYNFRLWHKKQIQ